MNLPNWLLGLMAAAALLVALSAAALVWAAGSATPASSSATAPPATRRWQWGLMLGVPLLVLGLYTQLGHPLAADPERQHPADLSAPTMVRKLAQRLAANPNQPEAWLMLARSYQVLGQPAQAVDAYARAAALAVRDLDVLTDWIEARIMAAQGRFDPESRRLLALAQALMQQQAVPHPGTLVLLALAELDAGQPQAARPYFEQLLPLYPDDSLDRLAIQQALTALRAGRDPRAASSARTTAASTPRP